MELINKIKRGCRCKMNHFHKWLFAYMREERRVKFFSHHFPRLYLSYYYRNWVGYFPDYKHPRDFCEKLLLYGLKNKNNKLFRQCADKAAVRDYVTAKGYADILNEVYGVYDTVEEIPFESLPNQFVLKITNTSGYNIICKDKTKLDIEKTKEQLKKWLVESNGFGFASGEWQYAYTKPRILVEKYLSNLGESSLVDYKFNCFKGKVYSCFVAYDRSADDPHGVVSYDDYDRDWNLTEGIKPIWHKNRKVFPKPKTYERMLEIASKLSEDFDYVRVDLYEIENDVLFSELTFAPNGYVPDFYEPRMLNELGEQLVLS